MGWFDEQIRRKDLSALYKAFTEENYKYVENELASHLRESISFYDNKEAFYHGFLVGIFSGMGGYLVDSNRETGNGRYDICVRSLDVKKPAIIIELKQAGCFQELEKQAEAALEQIRNRIYKELLLNEGYQNILCYGIGFYKKNCKVMLEDRIE